MLFYFFIYLKYAIRNVLRHKHENKACDGAAGAVQVGEKECDESFPEEAEIWV